MSLIALARQKSMEDDESFLSRTPDPALPQVAPDPEGEGEVPGIAPGGAPAAAPVATSASGSSAVEQPHGADIVDNAAMPGETSRPDPLPGVSSGSTPADPDEVPGKGAALPPGIPDGSVGVPSTRADRVAALAGEKVRGSISDGGSVDDMLAGLPARPSVASQREIAEFNRRRIAGLEIRRPINWPDFMTFPTEAEIRGLRRDGVTEDMVRHFEAEKQRQADAMEIRAREINTWIFSHGDPRLNERHRVERSRNRDEAIRKRANLLDHEKALIVAPGIDEITDAEIYKDRHYNIRFALLLKAEPDHINFLRKAPVAAWGHDSIRTVDGGRIRVREDEIRVTTVSLQAAQVMVMEAKARGWETLRISGDNEFCAAVRQACKEQGMGAIITRRGPLGLGPFSRPEVVMPALPEYLGPRPSIPPEEKSAPGPTTTADQAAARALLGEDEVPEKPSPGERTPAEPPSDRQLAFARSLAEKSGLDLPDVALMDKTACSSFIDEMKRASGGQREKGLDDVNVRNPLVEAEARTPASEEHQPS